MMTRRKVAVPCPGCKETIYLREYYGMEGGIYNEHCCKSRKDWYLFIEWLEKTGGFDISVFDNSPVWPEDEKEHRAFAETQGGY